MYSNLKNLLRARNISNKAFGDFLGVSEKTATNKLDEITDFTVGEARKTSVFLFPEYRFDYVFESVEK